MFIFQHPAVDCVVGDLISREKLTLQALMLHSEELSYMEHTLLDQEPVRCSPDHVTFGPKWLPRGSAAARLLEMFDCSDSLCVEVITYQAVYPLQFVYDWVHSVMHGTAPERIRGINASHSSRKQHPSCFCVADRRVVINHHPLRDTTWKPWNTWVCGINSTTASPLRLVGCSTFCTNTKASFTIVWELIWVFCCGPKLNC